MLTGQKIGIWLNPFKRVDCSLSVEAMFWFWNSPLPKRVHCFVNRRLICVHPLAVLVILFENLNVNWNNGLNLRSILHGTLLSKFKVSVDEKHWWDLDFENAIKQRIFANRSNITNVLCDGNGKLPPDNINNRATTTTMRWTALPRPAAPPPSGGAATVEVDSASPNWRKGKRSMSIGVANLPSLTTSPGVAPAVSHC